MGPIRHLIIALAEDAAPRGTVLRAQFRVSVETLMTVAITALAVALAVGYQVLRLPFLGGRSDRP